MSGGFSDAASKLWCKTSMATRLQRLQLAQLVSCGEELLQRQQLLAVTLPLDPHKTSAEVFGAHQLQRFFGSLGGAGVLRRKQILVGHLYVHRKGHEDLLGLLQLSFGLRQRWKLPGLCNPLVLDISRLLILQLD
jgi:hypothetical protein